ncbi:MAG: hypothetical protein IJC71_01500 [Clostridia bacterium]|nr:hypothetical protein [Clostridia bacterium]
MPVLSRILGRIIGFIPTAVPVFLAWLIMSPVPATSEIYRTPLYRPSDVPWFIWLWIVLAVVSDILLCMKKGIPAGLVLGAFPYAAAALVILLTGQGAFPTEIFWILGGFLFFYILYAVVYYVFYHEADKI